jgi:hypothetical protein
VRTRVRGLDLERILKLGVREGVAAFELGSRDLQVRERLVVVALGGSDRGMAEQVADLRERDAVLDES